MLQIEVPSQEFYNEATGEFDYVEKCILNLEHSLISVSKWESKWKTSFVDTVEKGLSRSQMIDYIRCMTLNQKVDPKVYAAIPPVSLEKIRDYITDTATATTIYDHRNNRGYHKKETITSELIYYQMINLGIPFECEKWHLNRLLTLIRVCSIRGTNAQMSINDIFAQNKQLNASRRAAMNSRG